MKNQRSADCGVNFFYTLDVDVRCSLINAVSRADADCKSAYICSSDKFFGFADLCIAGFKVCVALFLAADRTKLTLDGNVHRKRKIGNFFCEFNVIFKRHEASVKHNGGEAAGDAFFSKAETAAVIKMQSIIHRTIGHKLTHHCRINRNSAVVERSRNHLDNDRSTHLMHDLRNRHCRFEIVNVECRNRIVFFFGSFHESCRRNNHIKHLRSLN